MEWKEVIGGSQAWHTKPAAYFGVVMKNRFLTKKPFVTDKKGKCQPEARDDGRRHTPWPHCPSLSVQTCLDAGGDCSCSSRWVKC